MDAGAARALFDANAGDYDRVNTAISLGLDGRWRAWAGTTAAATTPHARVLDAFAGTGLVGLAAARAGAEVTLSDTSPAMLSRAADGARRQGLPVRVVPADLTSAELPFAARSFDAVTVSFGLRYLDSPAEVLRGLGDLIAPGGRLVVLEFVHPRPGPLATPAAFYFFRVLPRLAGWISGIPELYDYLVRSVDLIGDAGGLERIAADAGFAVESRRAFGFGLVAGLVCAPVA